MTEEEIKKKIFENKVVFKCRKKGCRSKEFYLRGTTRICKTCKSAELLKAGTAFQGQRMKLDKAVELLLKIQEEYADALTFLKEYETSYWEGLDGENTPWKPTYKSGYSYVTEKNNLVKKPRSISANRISKGTEFSEKTVWAFLQKINEWVGEDDRNYPFTNTNIWFPNCESGLLGLYHLLFEEIGKDESRYYPEPRSLETILEMLSR